MNATTRKVTDIDRSEKRWLEDALGQPLQDRDAVFIMVFTPDAPPDDAVRAEASAGLERVFSRAEAHAAEQGISDRQIDDAVEEAMKQVRPRGS
ncbi:MAG: hypothetical protein WD066_15070 [Planctomycetaceae bacterium]